MPQVRDGRAMPRSRQRSPVRSRGRGTSSKKRPTVGPSLLILECDPEKLPAEPTSFGEALESVAKGFFPRGRTIRVPAKTQPQLLADLGRLKTEVGNFQMVAIVAHSNVSEVSLTGDSAVSWMALGQWLAPFSPRIMVLVACEAGRWVASGSLFEGIPTLKELYASPVLVNDHQAACIKLLIPYFLSGRRLKDEDLRAGQIVNFLLTRGIVLRRTRRDFRTPGVLEGAAWTIGEEVLKAALRRLGEVRHS